MVMTMAGSSCRPDSLPHGPTHPSPMTPTLRHPFPLSAATTPRFRSINFSQESFPPSLRPFLAVDVCCHKMHNLGYQIGWSRRCLIGAHTFFFLRAAIGRGLSHQVNYGRGGCLLHACSKTEPPAPGLCGKPAAWMELLCCLLRDSTAQAIAARAARLMHSII